MWEYKFVRASTGFQVYDIDGQKQAGDVQLAALANDLSKEGWELMQTLVAGDKNPVLVAVFRRSTDR